MTMKVYLSGEIHTKWREDIVNKCNELNLDIESIRSHGRVWKYKGIAYVDGKKMAEAEWSATIVDKK